MPRSIISDTISITSRTRRQSISGAKIKWLSYGDFLMYYLVCSTGTHSLTIMAHHPYRANDGNVLQFLISYILFGLPVLYMQVILGQYTQMSVILLKHLAPVGHGLAYSYIAVMFIRSIHQGIDISTNIVYLLTSARYRLEWLVCPPTYANSCWTIDSNCTKDCLTNTNISAYIYYLSKFLEKPVMKIEDIYISLPPFQKILPMVFGWFMIVVCLIYATSNHRRLMGVMMYMVLTLMFVLLCGALLTKGGFYIFEVLTKFDSISFIAVSSWTKSIEGAAGLLALGRPFPIVFGAAIAPTAPSGILCVAAVTLNFLFTLFCTLITFSCYGIIKNSSYSNDKAIQDLPYHFNYITLGIIPQALPHMGVKQFWSMVYFLFSLVIQTNNQIMHLKTIEKCLCDTYPKLLKYHKYVLSFTCFFSFLAGLVLVGNGMYVVWEIVVEAAYIAAIVNTMFTSILVSWVYGVQALCDDIHYLCGNQPSKFWKVLWYLLPPMMIFTLFDRCKAVFTDLEFSEASVYFMIVLLYMAPVFIYGLIQTFRYIRKRNLLGLFRPSDLFGPPDFEDRRLRRIYNPRSEIRSRRRTDKCQHRCLLGNLSLRAYVQQDVSNFGSDLSSLTLEFSPEESVVSEEIAPKRT